MTVRALTAWLLGVGIQGHQGFFWFSAYGRALGAFECLKKFIPRSAVYVLSLVLHLGKGFVSLFQRRLKHSIHKQF